MIEINKIYNEDCLEGMKRIPDASIDAIICDLPYGKTRCKWDSIIPIDDLWKQYNRIIKDNGVIILTATQLFAAKLIIANEKYFRYDLVWEKTVPSGQLNVKKMPLRYHENILIFYKKTPTYNEQKGIGEPYKVKRTDNYPQNGYGKQRKTEIINNGYRHARSIIKFSNPRVGTLHPTQKPLDLMEYLIKTYTNEGDLVLDNCAGSGTTLLAAKNLNRQYIGFELDENYYNIAKNRLAAQLL